MRAFAIFFAIGLTGLALGKNVEVDLAIDRAEKAIEAELRAATIEGARSRRSAYKKTTPESRAMDSYNRLVRRSVDNLMQADSALGRQEAQQAVSRQIRDRRTGGRAPGHGEHNTRPVTIVNDICDGVTVDCTGQESNSVRSIDGTCNNVNNGFWGSISIQLRRYLENDYADGQGVPTGEATSRRRQSGGGGGHDGGSHDGGHHDGGSHDGGSLSGNTPIRVSGQCANNDRTNLPSPRTISREFHGNDDVPDKMATHFAAIMGQFLDHDITLTPETEVHDCCAGSTDENCFPISVSGDGFYNENGVSCLEFTRSLDFCSQQPREQVNGITAFVDASNVYGSDDETATTLRTLTGGLLKYTQSGDYVTLPVIDDALMAGDVRAIENPALASLHTLFVREHNRIATQLSGSDEEIYQKARRIVMAEMQNVVYGQYLPAILGNAAPSISSRTRYNSNVDPSIRNSFATAAYRFGHSMIQGLVEMVNEQTRSSEDSYSLQDSFFNTSKYFAYSGAGAEKIINGLMNQQSQTTDRFVIEDVSNHLFKETGAAFGSDLVARNIQRGRDHGLPSYNAFRIFCGQSEICSWRDRPSNILSTQWDDLRAIYDSPNDIDLFTGGLAETLNGGGLTGKTFQCIKEKQFEALLEGDRYFFTHDNVPFKWSDSQVNNIKTRTLAQIICDNTKIEQVRFNVFLSSSLLDCPATSTLDVSLF